MWPFQYVGECVKSSESASGTIQVVKTPLVLKEHATSAQEAANSFATS